MFMKKATALALLALAPSMLAACGSDGGDLSGSAIDDPSKPGVPGAPIAPENPPANKPGESKPAPGVVVAPGSNTGNVTLLGFVQGLAPTRRVDLADMENACRRNTGCETDLATFKAHLMTICPVEADCKDPVGMLLYKDRSPQQVAQQLYSASFPQSKDVAPVVEAALAGAVAGGEPVDSAADKYIDTLTQTAEDLKIQGGSEINWTQIGDLIVTIDPETGNDVTEQIQKDIEEVAAADPAQAETVTKLLAGESVDAAAAANLIEKVIAAAQP